MSPDPSHKAWLQNARKVKKHPSAATVDELRQAIEYLRFERGRIILTARRDAAPADPLPAGRRRPPVKSSRLDAIDALVTKYLELVAERTGDAPDAPAPGPVVDPA